MLRNPNESAARGQPVGPGVPRRTSPTSTRTCRRRSSPTSTATAGRSARSSRRTARATARPRGRSSSARRTRRRWPRAWTGRTRRGRSTRRTATRTRRPAEGRAGGRRQGQRGVPREQARPPDGHPPGEGHALRRLPLRRRTCTATTGCTGKSAPRSRSSASTATARRRNYTTLKTSGPARYTSARRRQGPQPARAADAVRHAALRGAGGARRHASGSSRTRWSRRGFRWEVVQTNDTITPGHARYNEKSRAREDRALRRDRQDGVGRPARRRREGTAPTRNEQHELHRLPLVVEPELASAATCRSRRT